MKSIHKSLLVLENWHFEYILSENDSATKVWEYLVFNQNQAKVNSNAALKIIKIKRRQKHLNKKESGARVSKI